MTLAAQAAWLAALVAGDPEFAIRLRAPVVDPPTATAPPGSKKAAPPSELPVPYADAVPNPKPLDIGTRPQARKLGTNITIFVNFDGVHIDYCNPANSHENCHWLERDTTFEPFSGNLAQRVAILDAMRSLVADFGIRVTGQRPPDDEPYVMVVYGGDSIDEEALGRAPAGDCWDDLPNEIAYVYLDGERSTWINGGASTALHESAHTWGFDHIGLEGALMAPSGGNTKTNYFDGCAQIVSDTLLTPADEPSCPQLNLELCGLGDFQYDVALLRMLFGAPYVDDRAPELSLVRPFDGVYYQGPANFRVELAVVDDLHPQIYELSIGIAGLVDDPSFSPVLDPSFDVEALPIGEWTFEVRLRDAAGNESSLEFVVVVGDHPIELDDGCACRSGGQRGHSGAFWALFALGVGACSRRRKPPQAAPFNPNPAASRPARCAGALRAVRI
jgi:MYXO-CTERM domain-containing protein